MEDCSQHAIDYDNQGETITLWKVAWEEIQNAGGHNNWFYAVALGCRPVGLKPLQ
jgi:hypothetical protein